MVDALFVAAKRGSHQAAAFWLSSRRAAEWSTKAAADAEGEAADEQTSSDLDVARAVVSALESRKAG